MIFLRNNSYYTDPVPPSTTYKYNSSFHGAQFSQLNNFSFYDSFDESRTVYLVKFSYVSPSVMFRSCPRRWRRLCVMLETLLRVRTHFEYLIILQNLHNDDNHNCNDSIGNTRKNNYDDSPRQNPVKTIFHSYISSKSLQS